MNKRAVIFLSLGVLFIINSVWQISAAQRGLDVITLSATDPPATIIKPADTSAVPRPTVLIAHGFAGSSVLMRGFALTLAHAGYTTISWDFRGHGRNPTPLELSSDANQLLQDAENALTEAEASGLVDTQHLAILGHSMGSGVALAYGNSHADTSATIAISPGGGTVTTTLPRNLLLMAGSLEAQFASNAERLFSLAGGYNNNFSTGAARQLVIVPHVEHISILFSPTAQKTARDWLDETFGVQPGASDYTDRRILWFVLGIFGSILVANAGLQVLPSSSQAPGDERPFWLRSVALPAGGLLTSILLWSVGLLGIDLSRLLGLLVGGYILVWFGIAGLISLIILRPHIPKPTAAQLVKALLALAALWLGVGLLGNYVWLPWLLIPQRLWLWIPGSIVSLPWFYAVAEVVRGYNLPRQVGWWVVQSVSIILGLALTIVLTPGLGFIFIILPLVPVMIGLHMLVISSRHGAWAYALPGAMFISWLLLAVFPL